MVQVVSGAATVHERPPGLAVASYDNTAEPPSLAGGIHDTTTEPPSAPGTADTLRGAVGAVPPGAALKPSSNDIGPRASVRLAWRM
ncbi:unannotated protein [freshwater metagenome]|uniref:Unannotated protein n=1 Tax=freshwater metagenome TaxID=449393 RepID=A0A6J6EVT8_9ZZZZ